MRAACDLSDADCRAALGELVAEGLIASDGFAGLRAIAAASSERRFNVDAAGRGSMVRPKPDASTDRDTSRDEAVKRWRGRCSPVTASYSVVCWRARSAA